MPKRKLTRLERIADAWELAWEPYGALSVFVDNACRVFMLAAILFIALGLAAAAFGVAGAVQCAAP